MIKLLNKPPVEHQIQQQEMKDSGWQFDNNNSVTIYFYKTSEMNGSSYVKIPLRSATLSIQNDDKYCSIWSILAHLHRVADSRIGHSTRVSN